MGLLMQAFGYSNAQMLQGAATRQLHSVAQAECYADVHRLTLYHVSPTVLAEAADELAISRLMVALPVITEWLGDAKKKQDGNPILAEAAAVQAEAWVDQQKGQQIDEKKIAKEGSQFIPLYRHNHEPDE